MAAHRKYPPQGAAQIIKDLAIQGNSLTGVAHHLKVATSTVKRWFKEDEDLEEAFLQGKDFERKALDDLIKRDAAAGKPANANAMFLLKCRHGYREKDDNNAKIGIDVQPNSVMVVVSHGTDEEWAAKAAEQQRKLIEANSHTPIVPAPLAAPVTAPAYTPLPVLEPPSWKSNA